MNQKINAETVALQALIKIKIYHISEISNYEFSDDNTLDEYSQTQDSMSEYISTNRKKMWYCHPLSFKKEGLHIIFLWQELGSFRFGKRM